MKLLRFLIRIILTVFISPILIMFAMIDVATSKEIDESVTIYFLKTLWTPKI